MRTEAILSVWDRVAIEAVRLFPRLLLGLALFLLFWLAGILVDLAVRRLLGDRAPAKSPVLALVGRSSKSALVLIGFVTALGTAGVNVTALVAGLGLTGFALGFALKDALSNFLAGALILFYRPFGIGDRISVTNLEGVVAEINLRYTILNAGNKTYLIPNSNLFTNPITIVATAADGNLTSDQGATAGARGTIGP